MSKTERTLKQRIIKHKQVVKNADSNNGLAMHVAETEHEIRWNKAELGYMKEGQWSKQKIKVCQSRHISTI